MTTSETPAGASAPADVASAFERGLQRGDNPQVAGADGPASTTLDSRWLGTWRRPGSARRAPCRVCGHTFRLDDTVYLRHAEDGRLADVTHHLRNLPCSGEAPGASGPPDPGAQAAFFHGVDDTDPRPDTLHTVRLMPDDPVLGRPGRRNACFVCTHTFRLFETVVVCPCSPEAPGCRKAVHQDPARGLGCFEQWRSELTVKQCPMNFRTLRRE
ncbi:hypothetical protein BIV25_08695 [Streptomyces sp. MUSC 14]|uniref:hypothetical protein n=1 Tax=Streptomyces sp. MUSC 14 TaxID=1354889 RepID=UPI0008F5916F|nr:hypothetical protein [Streptomyces sp. MUSC 14]OIJ99913.1 hypothetical protein BIV25_08695 [Streptomyces sp. MUSC 14]